MVHKLYAGAFLKRDGQYLLLKRADSRQLAPGKWSCVGGHIEPHELGAPLAACLREIEEETGIPQEQVRNLALRYIIMRKAGNTIRQSFVYFGETDAVDVVQSDEGMLHWVPEDELTDREFTQTFAAMLAHWQNTPSPQVVIGTAENDSGLRMNWAILEDFE